MDLTDYDWKKKVGFPINYDSSQSSGDEFDSAGVVMRHARHSSRFLLADGGDGAEADLLGSTPPRSRIRNKEKRRTLIDSGTSLQRLIREKKDEVDHVEPEHPSPVGDRLKKRSSLKLIRARERDWKQDMDQREGKADSLPSPNPMAAVPTVVESCNRFMSLRSTKCRELTETDRQLEPEVKESWRPERNEQLPASRVNFHKTFSMLINMGNIEKGCKRTISREEQVWQNELKDLIWLEIKAKIAGRTLAQQDTYLCAQRAIVPALIKNIFDYRFVNNNPCKNISKKLDTVQGSREDLLPYDSDEVELRNGEVKEGLEGGGCVELECSECSEAVGRAMREVSALLDSFHAAESLYPSSKAMTNEHPLLATQLFKNRMKALCLWFNTALHLRLKMLGMRRLLRSMRLKSEQRADSHRTSLGSDTPRQSSGAHHQTHVQFTMSTNPTDSSGSELSAHSDTIKEETETSEGDVSKGDDEIDSGVESTRHSQIGQTTPEVVVVVTDSAYSSQDTAFSASCWWNHVDVYHLGDLRDLTQLRLLGKCSVSFYREHHREILKTQGVRRCMMYLNNMRQHVLDKAFLTLEKPEVIHSGDQTEEDPVEVFAVEESKAESVHSENSKKAQELKRYGCWSEECLAMRLPSYRSHFLLLSSICLEAVHDYLSFRLESRPDHPSCLTVKQLIHELKEGLDISSEMRAEFIRHARAAATCSAEPGQKPSAPPDLSLLLQTFDSTADAVLKQYLSFLRTMSETEQMGRSWLQTEWEFTARLAKRIRGAAALAPLTFADIACNQLNRLRNILEEKFKQLVESEEAELDHTRQSVYTLCRLAQAIYAEERERTLQSAQWARALAARLARAPPPAYLHQRNQIFDSLMSIRDFIVMNVQFILKKSLMATPDEVPKDMNEGVIGRIRELLLQVFKLGFEIHKELHRFVNVPTAGVARAAWRRSRPDPEETATPRGMAPLRARLLRHDSLLEDAFDDINTFGDTQQSIELLLGSEEVEVRNAEQGAVQQEERQWAGKVGRAVIQFAKCWMLFVVEKCDRGRGTRPRWASQGLDFLILACDPCNTTHLSDEEFEELKQLMDGCISHVIGSRSGTTRVPDCTGPATSPRPRHRLHSPLSSSSASRERDPVPPASPRTPPPPTPPPAPPLAPDPLMCLTASESLLHSRRVQHATEQVDTERDRRLRAHRAVGRVLGPTVASYEPRLRQLTFKWQRGLKIGAGTFGKVYTVVNTESGQLLAMKELSIGAGDRRALQRAANELQVLEGIVHSHLVRYYGCELHREEMLLFMELCVEGSLEALVGTSGALPEHTTRRYTKQLLSALQALHQRSIVHRDVKSGNIFLTNEGHCLKLGDFGCAIKIRAHTTAPKELQGHVGTQAYMAPEVFMNSAGHGRAADVWSLGCVVTEMASGKRPFSEQEYSNYHIMFKVGMGERPHIPDSLSPEGQEFCMLCLTHDPKLRPRAEALMLHTFLMVKSDEDCKCEPAFLIA